MHDNRAEAARRMPRLPLVEGFGPPIMKETKEDAPVKDADKSGEAVGFSLLCMCL